MEYSIYLIWTTLNHTHFHTLSWSLTPYTGMVLDQRLQCHSKKYTDIYIHISFKIMFISSTTQSLASTQKHFFSFSRLYTCMEKVGFFYILFFHNSKINFFYTVFQLAKTLKCEVMFNVLYCELTPLSTFNIHC